MEPPYNEPLYNKVVGITTIFELFFSYVIGVSVCIFVALWLCLFGCVLQGQIRWKVL